MSSTPVKILFTKTNAQYGFMSNFAAYPITVNGLVYPTNEHYFQSVKFVDPVYAEHIRTKCATAAASKTAGRSRKYPIQPDWNTSRVDVMLVALRAKFGQHEDIRTRLLETGDAELVEHAIWDRFWGDGGGKGTGQNILGKLIMKVREELGGPPAPPIVIVPPTLKAPAKKKAGAKRTRATDELCDEVAE